MKEGAGERVPRRGQDWRPGSGDETAHVGNEDQSACFRGGFKWRGGER